MSMGVTSTFSRLAAFADGLGGFDCPLDADDGGSCVEGGVEDFARRVGLQSRLRAVVDGRSRMLSERYVRNRTVITGMNAENLIWISCASPLEMQLSKLI
jgi:hypothetical protein